MAVSPFRPMISPPHSVKSVAHTKSARSRRDRLLDFVDRSAARVITLGGLAVILCVIAIIVFVGAGAVPLLRGAKVTGANRGAVPSGSNAPRIPLCALSDEYQEQALLFSLGGTVSRVGSQGDVDSLLPVVPAESASVAAVGADFRGELIALGDSVGGVWFVPLEWRSLYDTSGRVVTPQFDSPSYARVFDSPTKITNVAVARDGDGRFLALVHSENGAVGLRRYDPEWERDERFLVLTDTTTLAVSGAVNQDGDLLAIGYADGRVGLFDIDDEITLRETLRVGVAPVTAVAFLLGGVTLVTGDAQGAVRTWLPTRLAADEPARYHTAREFRSHDAAVVRIAVSPRDRSFVTCDAKGAWRLCHSTTGATYHTEPGAGEYASFAFAPKGDGLIAARVDGALIGWTLENPHPDVSARTLFGKVWYEGYDSSAYVWQSTGGSDEFEPKMSLIPLMFGTLKGAVYSLLFSIPIALLAALYVSQLSAPRFRAIVKPTIELMAALPSVVVGFLAALWLAPFVSERVVGCVLMLLAIPAAALTSAYVWDWGARRHGWRRLEGKETALTAPAIILGVALAFVLEPYVSQVFFDGDFRHWISTTWDTPFDQRNSIVIGFALGFAVIPIIFTVAEDSLSSVPKALVSGALALGATRWQATWRVALRSASPGIFAAIMLGFGRAVGETMIVLMATGNTPVIDWSVFNGMRTMAAAIAVEIPEAAKGDSLYRTLFLTGFMLFVFTLVVNIAASFIGARLRRRYGRF